MSDQKHQEFSKAYAKCHEAFIRYCSALVYGKMNVEDLIQDVLLSAYQNFENVSNKDQFLHYLIRAARNRSISIWRKKKYKTEYLDRHAYNLESKQVSADTILEIGDLYKKIDMLPTKQKEALILFEISGFSMREIAAIQNKSEGSVKTSISRGRKKLAELMRENERNLNQAFGVLKSIIL